MTNKSLMASASRWHGFVFQMLCLLALCCLAAPADAADYRQLSVVPAVESCDQLGKTDLTGVADAPVTIASTKTVTTPKGNFCEVRGTVAPAIGFAVDLPIDHWTQRYLQTGCGALCGTLRVHIERASGCLPALNGEFALASDDMGHENAPGKMVDMSFAKDPQKIIDFAYRGNHETALVSKALIRAFYGRAPRYSYFMGCSDGGREALTEAERFPNDFDGISAGDPVALFTIQNSFYHTWDSLADYNADGKPIVDPSKVKLLHAAVLAHCPTLSKVSDGLLQDPRACDFDVASIACAAGATDTSRCFTADDIAVVNKLYQGAVDAQGNVYTYGAMRGSELNWRFMPLNSTRKPPQSTTEMHGIIVDEPVLPNGKEPKFDFSMATYQMMNNRAPLLNAADTDLKPFAAHGGKLIMFHGWADVSVTPLVSVAYYQGVQKFMGAAATNQFLRLFMIPGMGHCSNGGYDDFDVLSPLMAWTETNQAPAQLMSGKTAVAPMGMGGPGGPPGGPGGAPGGPGGGPRGQAPAQDNWASSDPVASPAPHLLATRPVYPFPYIAQYTGSGDPNDAANYVKVESPVGAAPITNNVSLSLIGPDNLSLYHVQNGQLVPDSAH